MPKLGPALAVGGGPVSVSGGNLTWVVIVAVIALLALAVAGWLVRDVLAASQGTEKMQEIDRRSRRRRGLPQAAVQDFGCFRLHYLLDLAPAAL